MRGIEITGPADGQPILFLHGAGANLGMWLPEIERLSDEFRCIAVDLPGHGDLRDGRFTLEAAVERVRKVIDEHAGGSAVVVGLSLGGYVAIATAASHPDQVGALVASGAGVEFQGVTAWVNRFQGLVLPLFGPLLRRMAAKSFARIGPPGTAEAMERQGGMSLKGAGQALRDLAGRDFHSMLERYRGPVLMLMGVRDKHNVAALPEMIRGLDDVTVEIIEDGGHSCSLSQPDAFSDAVRRFAVRGRSTR